MGKMEAAGEILSRGEILKSTDSQITLPQSQLSADEAIEMLRSQGCPEWQILVLQIAQDKRHDMAPPTLRFWDEKLKSYPDELICEALKLGRFFLFPCVDDVIDVVESILGQRAQAAGNQQWQKWKAEQKRAELEGLLATEEGIAEMRAALRKLAGKDQQ